MKWLLTMVVCTLISCQAARGEAAVVEGYTDEKGIIHYYKAKKPELVPTEEEKGLLAEKAVRDKYAKDLEMRLLDEGMDTTITTDGRYGQNLVFQSRSVNRIFAHKMINTKGFATGLKALNFLSVRFQTGYEREYGDPRVESWTYDLLP